MGIRKGIEKAVTAAVEELKAISKPIEGKESIAQVAAISSADEEVGQLIAEAMERVGTTALLQLKNQKASQLN